MVYGLSRVVAQDEGIHGEPFRAVDTLLLQTHDPGEVELVIVHNQHLAVSYTYPRKSRGPRWVALLLRTSVGNGLAVDKPLCHGGLPNGVKHVMRRSLNCKALPIWPTYIFTVWRGSCWPGACCADNVPRGA